MRAARSRSGFLAARGRAALHAACAVALVLGAPAAARAGRESGIQMTPDSQLYLISKDVGDDRWAITYDLAHKTVTGNVFPLGGGVPQFIWCDITSVDQAPDPADAMYHLTCQFAESCASAPCSNQWGAPFEVPPLPGSFLLPANTQSTLAGNVQPIFNASCAVPTCHVKLGLGPVNLSEGVAYDNIFEVRATENSDKFYVAPFNSDASYLFNKVDGTATPRMPLLRAPLPDDEENLIRTWILEGAANN